MIFLSWFPFVAFATIGLSAPGASEELHPLKAAEFNPIDDYLESFLTPRACTSGFGLCPNDSICCPLGGDCCGGGKCCGKGNFCVGGGCCPTTQNGCANKGCCPKNSNCCFNGSCCDSAHYCVKVSSTTAGCCPNGKICTA